MEAIKKKKGRPKIQYSKKKQTIWVGVMTEKIDRVGGKEAAQKKLAELAELSF